MDLTRDGLQQPPMGGGMNGIVVMFPLEKLLNRRTSFTAAEAKKVRPSERFYREPAKTTVNSGEANFSARF